MSDEPRQIVRAPFPGEVIPAYSTLQLLLGARHVVLKPEIKIEKIVEEKPKATGPKERKTTGMEKVRESHSRLKELLVETLTDLEISEELGVNHRVIQRYIAARPELKALSAKRREVRLQRSIKNLATKAKKETQAAIDRFEARLPLMKQMLMECRTNVYIAVELEICERLVTQYIGKSPELKALSERRFQARKSATPRRIDEIRGPIAEMQAAGKTTSAIAKALGMERGNVWKYMRMIEEEESRS